MYFFIISTLLNNSEEAIYNKFVDISEGILSLLDEISEDELRDTAYDYFISANEDWDSEYDDIPESSLLEYYAEAKGEELSKGGYPMLQVYSEILDEFFDSDPIDFKSLRESIEKFDTIENF